MHKTTEAEFETYKGSVELWLDVFGLKGWEHHFKMKNTGDAAAMVIWDRVGRICTFFLANRFYSRPTEEMLKRYGFHEVCELLLGIVNDLAKSRFVASEDSVDAEIHNVIRVLENVLFKGSNYE